MTFLEAHTQNVFIHSNRAEVLSVLWRWALISFTVPFFLRCFLLSMGVNERESERKIWIFNIVCVSGEQLETSETWSALHKTRNHSSWKCGWARLRRRNSMLSDYLLLSLTENAIIVVFHEWIMSRILYISGCLASENLQITLSGHQMSPLDLDSGQHHAWSSSDAWENLHPEHDLTTVRTFSLSPIRYSASVLSTLFAFLIRFASFPAWQWEKYIFPGSDVR